MTELPGSFVSEQLIRPDLLEMIYWLTSLGKYLLKRKSNMLFPEAFTGQKKTKLPGNSFMTEIPII